MIRAAILLVFLTVCHVPSEKLSFGQDASGKAAARDRETLLRDARSRVQKWPELRMWLPEKDVAFFSDNFAVIESVLREALSDSNEDIRKDAAYVIRGIGRKALSLEPTLVERIEREPSRFIRMYLYDAARSIGAKSDKMAECLRRRFAALEKEPNVREHNYDYTPTSERIELASALLKVDGDPGRKNQYRDLVLRWLKSPPANLRGLDLGEYWDQCWVAVNVVENTGEPREAAPLLEALRKDPHRKAWVYIKASRALEVIQGEAGQKTRPNASTSDVDRLRSLFASSPGQEGKELPNRKARSEHRIKFANRNLTVAFDDDGDAIVVSRADQEKRLRLPSGLFWDEPVFSSNGEFIFAIENRRSGGRGYSPLSIERMRLPSAGEGLDSIRQERILAPSDLKSPEFKNLFISQIYAASPNGKRLLVLLGYSDTTKSSRGTTYYTYRPFFLDVESKRLQLVQP
jgi:hypothetical protein